MTLAALWLCSLLLVWIAAKAHQQREIDELINELLDNAAESQTQLETANEHIAFLEQELTLAVSISKRLEESLVNRFASVYAPDLSQKQPETSSPKKPRKVLLDILPKGEICTQGAITWKREEDCFVYGWQDDEEYEECSLEQDLDQDPNQDKDNPNDEIRNY